MRAGRAVRERFESWQRLSRAIDSVFVSTPEAAGETSVTVDGFEQHDRAVHLVDDRQEHFVEVRLAAADKQNVNAPKITASC